MHFEYLRCVYIKEYYGEYTEKKAGKKMKNEPLKIALAYVGVIVGAGLSSGQDILQYFLSFGNIGLVGVVILGILNIVFGRIIITLGSYYQANNHQEVLEEITSPITNKIIDWTLIISNFVIGFVMIAGAGANLKQQFNMPEWIGALICAILIVIVAFMDFEKITGVLGVFTPIIFVLILLITAYTFFGKGYDFSKLDEVSRTIPSALPNVWLSVINYFSLCILTGVSMAFVLGGSVVRIGVAQKAGVKGGLMVGILILCSALSLFANIGDIKDADIPMLEIVKNIHPIFSTIYALVIFALIFNTAFSLFYATAKRFSDSDKKLKLYIIIIIALGYACSFVGFKDLISYAYPALGYLGIILLVVLFATWIKNHKNIMREMFLRRKMIRLSIKKHDKNRKFTTTDQNILDNLGKDSVVDGKTLKKDIKNYAKEIIDSDEDEKDFADRELELRKKDPKYKL